MLRWWNRSLLIFSATSNVGSRSYLVIADFSMAPGVLASFKGLFFVDRFWFDCFVVFYHGPSIITFNSPFAIGPPWPKKDKAYGRPRSGCVIALKNEAKLAKRCNSYRDYMAPNARDQSTTNVVVRAFKPIQLVLCRTRWRCWFEVFETCFRPSLRG